MRVTFWGTRGSLPAPIGAKAVRGKIVSALLKASGRGFQSSEEAQSFVDTELTFAEGNTYGGNSSCVELETGGEEFLICDMGSGIRELGFSALGRRAGKPGVYHIVQSHLHWDHIMGFPFFVPAYIPGNVVRIYGCHPNIEESMKRQSSGPNFPVEFDKLGAKVEFVTLKPDEEVEIAGFKVLPKLQLHGNDSYGYRFTKDDKIVVYTTDSEHKLEDAAEVEEFGSFFREADLVIFDSMYSLADAISLKADWGHSSNVVGVELCQIAEAKRLALFHHEPVYDDARLDAILAETRRFEEITRGDVPLEVIAAYDGLTIEL